jgi:HAE1 family hydrophobic/amphiphilic exporter-1
MAMLFIYMITAALFESIVLPFVALLAVPLSFVGVALAFWITGEPFDRTAYVGLILLAGIAINNALLFVHRAGVVRRRLRDARAAARRAALERVRPILMTTATSVAGLVPLAWSVDSNAVAGWRSLALAGTGGLLASALFTLTVIPALFVLLTGTRKENVSCV